MGPMGPTPPPVVDSQSIRISMASRVPITVGDVTWQTDEAYVSPGLKRTLGGSSPITDLPALTNQGVMRTIRFSRDSWFITVPGLPANGQVQVRLHFVEMNSIASVVGGRVFHVDIQGSRVLENFDIYQEAGGEAFKAISREFTATVAADGTVRVDMVKGPSFNPSLAALEVVVP